VIVVPIASAALLPLAAIHALLASCAEWLAAPTAVLLDLAARGFLASCEAFAAIPLGRSLPPLDVAQGIVLCASCLSLLFARRWRTGVLVIALGALGLAGAEWRLRAREQPIGIVRATFLDVGQGDGALIDMPDGRLVMIDAGGAVGAGIDPGAAAIVPLLAARRRERIDLLVITHPHPDHYGGVRAVLDAVEVGEIWDTGQGDDESPEGELAALLELARERGVAVRRPEATCDRHHRFGAATIHVLWPCPAFDPGWDPNDNSLVLEIALGSRTLLLTGDIERHAEGALATSGVLARVDVLKVGHHGSRTSSTSAFLTAVDPRVAIVSAGRTNRFGHPHPEVIERLEEAADHVVRVDREGGVIVSTDGESLDVAAWSGRALSVE
jgi:competence protein ComEC